MKSLIVPLALMLAFPGAWAMGAVGPVGRLGPVGAIGPRNADSMEVGHQRAPGIVSPPAAPAQANPAQAGPARAGNRIEVSGNTVSGAGCANDVGTSVNSIDVAGARLDGRTVVVQGRNANDVRTRDCPEYPARRQTAPGEANRNSIRIR